VAWPAEGLRPAGEASVLADQRSARANDVGGHTEDGFRDLTKYGRECMDAVDVWDANPLLTIDSESYTHPMLKSCAWALVAASCMCFGCDGAKTQSGPLAPGNSATGEDFCRSLVDQQVSLLSRCFGGTEAYWRDELYLGGECDQVGAGLAAKTLAYDPSKGADCLKRMSQASCFSNDVIDSCSSALAGRLPVGSPCDPNNGITSICAPGTFCFSAYQTCGGTCQPKVQPGGSCANTTTTGYYSCALGSTCGNQNQLCIPDVAEGQACRGPSAGQCRTGFYCDGNGSTTGTCHKQQTSGSCDPFLVQCALGYSCAGPDGAQTCSKWKMSGDSCTPGWSECFWGLSCGSDGKCASIEASENQPCGQNAQDERVDCSAGLYCAQSAGSSMGSCQRQKPAGAACAGSSVAYECAGKVAYCYSTTKLCVACN
jgi:hypothetical protein